MKRRLLACCGIVLSVLSARTAGAQTQYVSQGDSPQWLKDRRYNEGIGLRLGDFEFHPGIAGEVGYDSNYLLRSDRTGVVNGPPNAPVVPALEFRITPSAYISTLGEQRREGDVNAPPPNMTFRGGANLTYREFACLGSNCGGQNDITQERGFSAAADARLDILPERPVGGALFATYARAQQPNLTTVDPNLAFNSDTVGVGAELALQPNAGTLDWHFGYQLHTTVFEDQPGMAFNNLSHTLTTRGRWKFRPRTALVYDGSLAFSTYTNSNLASQQGLVNSSPVSARIGVNGLFTDRLAVLAMVGWAATFNEAPVPNIPQYDSVIGQAELHWFLAANPGASALSELGLALSAVTLGYSRSYAPSFIGNFYGSDRGYLRFNYFFAGRALVTLEGGVGAVEYPNIIWLQDGSLRHSGFTDIRADATLFGEYRFTNTFGVNATLRYTTNISNVHDMPDTFATRTMDFFDMGWSRFEAFLGARLFL